MMFDYIKFIEEVAYPVYDVVYIDAPDWLYNDIYESIYEYKARRLYFMKKKTNSTRIESTPQDLYFWYQYKDKLNDVWEDRPATSSRSILLLTGRI